MLVRLADRSVLLTGVVASTREAFEAEEVAPHERDPDQARSSIRRLKQIAEAAGAEIWVGHDPEDPHWRHDR